MKRLIALHIPVWLCMTILILSFVAVSYVEAV